MAATQAMQDAAQLGRAAHQAQVHGCSACGLIPPALLMLCWLVAPGISETEKTRVRKRMCKLSVQNLEWLKPSELPEGRVGTDIGD